MTRLIQLARAAAVGFLCVAEAGCSPTAPSGSSEGVTIYEHPNYGGAARRLGADERDLKDIRGPCSGDWENCISSIRIFRQ